MKLDDIEDLIKFESDIKNDIMDSDEIKMIEKIMETKALVTIPKSKQNKLNKIVKTNRYKFWLGKNEIDVARAEVGYKPIKIQVKKCLSCRGSFQSEGSHNRMCQLCRKDHGYQD